MGDCSPLKCALAFRIGQRPCRVIGPQPAVPAWGIEGVLRPSACGLKITSLLPPLHLSHALLPLLLLLLSLLSSSSSTNSYPCGVSLSLIQRYPCSLFSCLCHPTYFPPPPASYVLISCHSYVRVPKASVHSAEPTTALGHTTPRATTTHLSMLAAPVKTNPSRCLLTAQQYQQPHALATT